MDYFGKSNLDFSDFKRTLPKDIADDEEKIKYIKCLYRKIYLLNLLKNRSELADKTCNNYFKVSFSCILESFHLFINKDLRAAYLVLRVSIESYLKFVLLNFINNYNLKHKVNERNFSINYDLLIDILSDTKELDCFNIEHSLEVFSNYYSRLSSLAHANTNLIDNFNPEYLFEIPCHSEKIFKEFYNIFKTLVELYAKLLIPICLNSFVNWDLIVLKRILKVGLSNKAINDIINNILEAKKYF